MHVCAGCRRAVCASVEMGGPNRRLVLLSQHVVLHQPPELFSFWLRALAETPPDSGPPLSLDLPNSETKWGPKP